ncbi:MAG: hypothetical protein PUA77_02990 [Lachnospiraceae bacterium]|nr:hypothetical protein [Lachnospiraceae bacterium]
MRKKFVVFGWVLALCIGLQTVVCMANTIPAVRLTDQDEFEYYADENEKVKVDSLSLTEFSGMAPGDERTQIIRLHNDSEDTVNFYISQKTLDTLEDDNRSSGGAYYFNLLVGDDFSNAVSLLDSQAGGYSADGTGSREGLAEVKELENYTFLATVEPGQDTYLYLTLKLEGEGNDNRASNNYTDAIAHLQLSFRAYDVEHEVTYGEDTEIVTVEKRVTTTKKTTQVKTGDSFQYGVFAVILLAGVVLVVVAVVKRRKGDA